MMMDATACHEDFTPAEEGQQFVELAERHGWTMAELCKQFRKSESYINSRVVIATKDAHVRDAVNEQIPLDTFTVDDLPRNLGADKRDR